MTRKLIIAAVTVAAFAAAAFAATYVAPAGCECGPGACGVACPCGCQD